MTKPNTEQIIDAIICLGVPYMNDDWFKFPKDQWHILEGFRATKGYQEAREQIKKLLVEELKTLKNCNIESKNHGSVSVILLSDIVKRIAQLEGKS